MTSIISSKYRLPTIEPLVKNQSFLNSANKPLLITGIDVDTGRKDDYVVKLMKAERMSGEAAMRELIAAFIAMELDLPVTLPAVINISKEFIDLLKGESEYSVAAKSLGYNFGTKYVDKFQTFAINQALPNTLISSAMEIFAFDALINNTDRSHESPKKPNLLTNGRELLIFDHELAFGFVFEPSFNRNKEPWKILPADRFWIEKHCLFRILKGNTFDEKGLLSKFAKLNREFWDRVWNLIPKPWRNKEQFDLIRNTIDQIVSNSEVFLKNLQLILA